MKEEELEKLLEGIDFKNLTSEQITGEKGLLKLLTKRIIEKAMSVEIDEHLGYGKHDPAVKNTGNSRNWEQRHFLYLNISIGIAASLLFSINRFFLWISITNPDISRNTTGLSTGTAISMDYGRK